MTNISSRTLIIAAIVLIVGFGAGYSVTGTKPTAGTHMMPDGGMMAQNIDQHFIVQMIPHHEGAIEMAKIALERSKRPEILSLANGIIEAQEREIRDMQNWYRSWYGSVPSGSGMGVMHMGGMEGDVDELKTISDGDFDREFIEQMIPHHEMAVVMAQMLQAATNRAEMKQLADDVITSQSREIEMMRGWLETWY